MSYVPLLWAILSALLFGASTPAAKVLLGEVGPVTLAGLLYIGAAAFSAAFARRGGSNAARGSFRNLALLGGAVLAGGVLGPVAMLYGVSRAPASTSALWLNLETPATALLGAAFFREHLSRRGWSAVALVSVGSVVLAAPAGFALAPAALLLLAACLCWGLDNNLTALIDGFTPAQSTFVKGLVAGLVNLTLGRVLGEPWPSLPVMAGAVVVGTLAYGASLVLYVGAAQHLGATRSQMAFATAPIFGVLLSWTALSEPVLATQLLAGCLMTIGVWLGAIDAHTHRHGHEKTRHTHWHRHDDGHHDHDHEHMPRLGWHVHEHEHAVFEHEHEHRSDLHHRHPHG